MQFVAVLPRDFLNSYSAPSVMISSCISFHETCTLSTSNCKGLSHQEFHEDLDPTCSFQRWRDRHCNSEVWWHLSTKFPSATHTQLSSRGKGTSEVFLGARCGVREPVPTRALLMGLGTSAGKQQKLTLTAQRKRAAVSCLRRLLSVPCNFPAFLE